MIIKKFAILLSVVSIMSLSLLACGSTSSNSNNKDAASNSPSENVTQPTPSTTDDIPEEERVPVYVFSSDKYYHVDKDCEAIPEDAKPQESTASNSEDSNDKYMRLAKKAAENCGYLPCPKCAGGTEEADSSK